ncbi:MAG: hypothetical protein PHU71_07220, partial [Candidatus Gracilibacteria bacterium]|nr:hypothetical protein [Candidatus Gracilibacteria bacterium]
DYAMQFSRPLNEEEAMHGIKAHQPENRGYGQIVVTDISKVKNVHITFSNLKIVFILSALFRYWSREKRLLYTRMPQIMQQNAGFEVSGILLVFGWCLNLLNDS